MSMITAVILAAGKGTRMKSDLPKVLHQVNGKAMISYVIEAAQESGADKSVLVVGHGAEQVRAALGHDLAYALQMPQWGTGHALQCAVPAIDPACRSILVLCGDTPLITAQTLQALMAEFQKSQSACTVLTTMMEDPFGYGRIVRDADGRIAKIIEEKDADYEQKQIKEVNTAIYCFDYQLLLSVINDLDNDNRQREYYLTDLLELLSQKGHKVHSMLLADSDEVMGINDRIQLAQAACILRKKKNRSLMAAGVSIVDSANTYIEDDVEIGIDTVIEPYTFIRGRTVIGCACQIGPNTDIDSAVIGNKCQIRQSTIVGCHMGNDCNIGPFSYMRPGTVLADQVKVGGFVETKKAQVDSGSKIPHLSYIGDTKIGRDVNIGCGTITCNYDGFAKYTTIIEDGAFIGSNTNLIAPVTVGKRAVVAAGSSVSKDVPADALAIERAEQRNIEGWAEKNRCRKGRKEK
jgi:bifunctional UDP-N-acetylglucosamine pyrophosphorylase/glucosamine-1-phosphate N-acetyltransferase